MAKPHRVTSQVEGCELVVKRTFEAPRELVFEAFREPRHLVRWWGPDGWTLPVCNIDFRPGGVWHYCMRSPDGDMVSWGKAVYEEIAEPERMIYVDVFSDELGNAVAGMPEARVVMEFVAQEGRTILVSRAQYPTEEDLKVVLDMGIVEGMSQTLDRLDNLLQDLQ